MSLRPRKFQFKNRHKRRRLVLPTTSQLAYGNMGVRILQPLWVSSKQIFRYKLFLKKAAKRSDITSRKIWFNLFPHLPLTRKIEGSRMGKGKGKLAGWVAQLSPKANIFEFKNLRNGRAQYYGKQLIHKLPVKATIFSKSATYITLPLNESRKITYQNFW